MQKVNPPDFYVKDVIEEIVDYMSQNQTNNKSQIIRNLHSSNTLLPYFNQIEREYFGSGQNLQSYISTLEQPETVLGIEKSKLKELYKYFYSSESSFRKQLYKLTPRYCPICDAEWGYASHTLDHILPESKFPQFAILPLNLVPTCYRCNHSKSSTVGYEADQGVFNPYFNSINLLPYLKCYTYIKEDDFVTHIHIKNESDLGLDPQKYGKLKFFYEEVYKLNETYSEVARVSVLNNFIDTLSEFEDITEDVIKDYFNSLVRNNKENLIAKGIVDLEFLKILVVESLQNLDSEACELFKKKIQEKRQISPIQDVF
ncbi:HNH endonuclease [Streptococcus suis]|uniref:HNH endonuclease n=1 Tax=Streptococcus suis TaxID=1307 RepID=UPI0005CF45DB|nr:HNH endonuclease signature motif containing protein [Streptococcus suis]NQH80403.1 HNH endonuclease [Streptococcus suis]CYU72338.1 Uncharacterised protein [Streptococcus suis]